MLNKFTPKLDVMYLSLYARTISNCHNPQGLSMHANFLSKPCSNVQATINQPRYTRYTLYKTYIERNQQIKSQSINMGPPRRKLLETETETLTPPPELPPNHHIGRVIKATGNNVYSVELPSSSAAAAASAASASEPAPTSEPTKTAQSHSSTAPKTILVELNPRFRSTIWLKRGSYVLVDTSPHLERGNKLKGEIVNVVRDEKEWRKAAYWYVWVD